jgi:hypothetical protein
VPTRITINRGDGTSFVAVALGNVIAENDGTAAATAICPTYGWTLVNGVSPKMRTSATDIAANGSKLFVQNLLPSGSNPNGMTRVLCVTSSSGADVSPRGGSVQQTLGDGEYLEVINTSPVQIGSPRTYVPADMPDMASALADAEAAMQAP